MDNGNFFVMLTHPACEYIPMTEGDGDLAKFETEQKARECAEQNPLGEAYGYEVFEIGCGL